jgi:hypothetical protein
MWRSDLVVGARPVPSRKYQPKVVFFRHINDFVSVKMSENAEK